MNESEARFMGRGFCGRNIKKKLGFNDLKDGMTVLWVAKIVTKYTINIVKIEKIGRGVDKNNGYKPYTMIWANYPTDPRADFTGLPLPKGKESFLIKDILNEKFDKFYSLKNYGN